MKKKIILFLLWDIFIYLFLFMYNTIASNLRSLAARNFDPKYNLIIVFIVTLFYIFAGLTYGFIINDKKITTLHPYKKYYIYEFVIIGLNALFMSTIFIWEWFGMNNYLPNWLVSNIYVTNSIGSIIFGIELYRLIKNLKV